MCKLAWKQKAVITCRDECDIQGIVDVGKCEDILPDLVSHMAGLTTAVFQREKNLVSFACDSVLANFFSQRLIQLEYALAIGETSLSNEKKSLRMNIPLHILTSKKTTIGPSLSLAQSVPKFFSSRLGSPCLASSASSPFTGSLKYLEKAYLRDSLKLNGAKTAWQQ